MICQNDMQHGRSLVHSSNVVHYQVAVMTGCHFELCMYILFCYFITEIGTTTFIHILAADSAEERDEWIESLRKASVRPHNNM